VVLVLSVLVTAGLYSVPLGHTLGYPLLLLSTLAHEMGHGITAWIVGGTFSSFEMWSDGSGVAHTGSSGRIASGLISAGGLVGPSIAALFCFVMGRKAKLARAALFVLGVVGLLMLVLVVRNAFGIAFVLGAAIIALLVAVKGGPRLSQGLLVFVGVQLALSVYSRGDYLFTQVAHTTAGDMPSDVAHMSEALFLPYWFWGVACGGFSVIVLLFGLYWLLRGERGSAATPPLP
jgi:hypothetical protein